MKVTKSQYMSSHRRLGTDNTSLILTSDAQAAFSAAITIPYVKRFYMLGDHKYHDLAPYMVARASRASTASCRPCCTSACSRAGTIRG